MRLHKSIISFLATVSIIIVSCSISFAQLETLKGIELKDGSIIYGKIIQMNVYKVIVQGKDGITSTYNFDEVQSFIKESVSVPAEIDTQKSSVNAVEKPISIKGIYIGIPVDEAGILIKTILGDDWTITTVGNVDIVLADYRFGNESIFVRKLVGIGEYVLDSQNIGDYGFAIRHYKFYEGFISADKNSKKVTRIALSGELVDTIFNAKRVNSEGFMKQFIQHFNLPEIKWIPTERYLINGWNYESPNGYNIMIRTNKLIDITKIETKSKYERKMPQIEFDL